jgi:hypothetical protein
MEEGRGEWKKEGGNGRKGGNGRMKGEPKKTRCVDPPPHAYFVQSPSQRETIPTIFGERERVEEEEEQEDQEQKSEGDDKEERGNRTGGVCVFSPPSLIPFRLLLSPLPSLLLPLSSLSLLLSLLLSLILPA